MTCQDKSLLAPALASTPVIPRYRQIIRKRAVLMLAIALAMMASLMVDVTCGSSGLPLSALWQALFQPEKVNAGIHVIVWDIRLPYALMALLVGMALGLAGAEMQTILNNPLATPFTLGVSSAAALALRWRLCWGSVFPVFLPPVYPGQCVHLCAFIRVTLDGITRWTGVAASGVVLFGIALVFTFNALVAIMQFVADEDTLQGLVFWTMGSLVRASWENWAYWPWCLLLCFLRVTKRTATHGITSGRREGDELWDSCPPFTPAVIVAYQLVISAGGSFRRADWFYWSRCTAHCANTFGEDHRFYLPGSVLIGGLVLSLASIAAKNSIPGVMVPVGIVTSLVGVPFF